MQLLETTARVWSHHLSVWTAVYAAAVHGSVERQPPHYISVLDGFYAGLIAILLIASNQ